MKRELLIGTLLVGLVAAGSCGDCRSTVHLAFLFDSSSAAAIKLVVLVNQHEYNFTKNVGSNHVTLDVMTWVEPSLYVPVAANGCVNPLGTDCAPGVTAIDARTAAVTVSVVEPWTPVAGSVAWIVTVPVAIDVATPLLPG